MCRGMHFLTPGIVSVGKLVIQELSWQGEGVLLRVVNEHNHEMVESSASIQIL